MNINEAFPSRYLKAADLQKQRHTVTIASIVMEEGIDKPIIYFQNRQKGMVVNKTNAMMIASLYGDNTDNWIGRQIELYEASVPFNNNFVAAIRVMAPQQPMPVHQNEPATQARTIHPAPDPNAPLVTQPQGGGGFNSPASGGDLDDIIPF